MQTKKMRSFIKLIGVTMTGLLGFGAGDIHVFSNTGLAGVSEASGASRAWGVRYGFVNMADGLDSGLQGANLGAFSGKISGLKGFSGASDFSGIFGIPGPSGFLGASDLGGYATLLVVQADLISGYVDLLGLLLCLLGWFCSIVLLVRYQGLGFRKDWWDLEAQKKSESIVKPLQLYPTDVTDRV